jgi:hypothetical protein
MKNIINKVIMVLLFVSANFSFANAQSMDLAFSMQMQNTNIQDAVIYPNPVTDFKFKVKSEQIIFSVEVINVIGKSILKQTNESFSTDDVLINLGSCEKGMYLVKITFDDDEYIIKKLLVK